MSNSNPTGTGIAGARTSQYTIKYKAYGAPAASPPKVRKRPSEHIKEALDPPLSTRPGVVRAKPFIVDKHNLAEQRNYFISSVPEDEPLFQPYPPEVLFTGYEAFQKYTTVLHLRNNDKVVRRIQLLSQDPKITVHLQSSSAGGQTVYSDIGSSKVACGMEVAYTITFYPETDRDFTSELLAITDREKFLIPVKCVGLKAMLDIPDEIMFPPTPAKCTYKKNVTIHNVAKKKAEFSLNAKGVFTVRPKEYKLNPGEFFQCSVYFLPPKVCSCEGELEVTLKDSGDQLFSKLIGLGTELNVGLSTGVIAAPTTFIRRTSHMTLQIYNNSSSVAYFLWPKFATERELLDYAEEFGDYSFDEFAECPKSQEDAQLSCNIDKAFFVTPAKGEVWPGTLVELIVTFCPPKPLSYVSSTSCIISGKSDPLKLVLQGVGVGPLCRFTTCELDLGDLCLFSENKFEISLANLGDLDAEFRLMETLPSSMVTFRFEPDKGTVDIGDVRTIVAKVCGNLMGDFTEKFLWEITDSIDTLSLTFKGRIIRPSFSVNMKELEFGTVSYGLHTTRELVLKNSSPVLLPFFFRVPHIEGSPPEFTVAPNSFSLGPGQQTTVTVELVPWEERKYITTLSLDIPNVGNDFATIPVQATCVAPIVKISSDALFYGHCFLRYEYTKCLNLINESPVPARFEVQSQDEESRKAAILRPKADSGIVPAASTFQLEFVISTQSLGDVLMATTVSISGKEFVHFPVKVSAISIGPIIKIERPISKKGQQTEMSAWVPALDFGKVQVLKDHYLSVLLKNTCCIPAPLRISIAKKDSVYHLSLTEAVLQPDESVELKVRAYLDDASKFSDKVVIVTEGSEMFVPLSAIGVGSTLLAKELETGFVHFGDQFTLRQFTYSFAVQNMGRKPQTLAWENDTLRKQRANKNQDEKKPGGKNTAVAVQDLVPVFTVAPEKFTIKQYSSSAITISGYTTEPGHVQEDFTCKMTSAKDVQYIKLSADADMAALTLVFSATTLRFVQNNGWGADGPHELTKALTCENVSKLPLSFSLAIKPPFQINQADWTLPPGGSGEVTVSLEKQDSKEKQSTIIQGKLDIMYTGTLEKNNIDLVAHINYPNLSVSTENLQFGCVIENTCKRSLLKLKNTSTLDVWYNWIFEEKSIRVSRQNVEKSSSDKVPANQLFDILPVRGYLRPDEDESVEVSYFAHPGYDCCVLAACEVSGGPRYTTRLQAESGFIAYSFSRSALDFHVQPFNKIAAKEFSLTNVGRVPFEFDVNYVKGKALEEVTPMNGSLAPGGKQKFTVSVCPGVPDRFKDVLTVQVAYYTPSEIKVFGSGAFPHIMIDTTRVRSHSYLSRAAEAFSNVYTAIQTGLALYSHRSSESIPSEAAAEGVTRFERVGNEHEPEVERPDIPTIDQVDAEIDRLCFMELLGDRDDGEFQKFLLSKYICDFENVILGETKLKTIKVVNDGPLPVTFRTSMQSVKSKGLSLDPDRLVTLPPLSAKSFTELTVKFKTDYPKFPTGVIDYTVPLYIKEGPQMSLRFKAYVTKPLMDVSSEYLDFGAVQLGQCKIMYVRLTNTGDVACNWNVVKPEPAPNETNDNSVFTCEPSMGSIPPHKYIDLEIKFLPVHKKKSHYAVFNVELEHNPEEMKFLCRGHSYVPVFTIEPSAIELGPILPGATEAAKVICTIQNTADEPLELYSLALDPQYVQEEELLRAAEGYNDHGVLLLDRRDAGMPFWDLNRSKKNSKEPSPREAPPEKTEKPKGKGAAPVEEPKVPVVSHANKLLIIMLGPPVIGKTTQANKLSMRFNCPIVDMEKVLAAAVTGPSPVVGGNDLTPPESFSELEKRVFASLRAKLESAECTFGAIFDHFETSYPTSLSLLKCVLHAAGLVPLDPSAGDKKGADKKKPPPKGKDKTEEVPSNEPLVVPRIYWVGDATVYVLDLQARREELAGRYAEIPEVDQCKRKNFFDLPPELASPPPAATAPAAPAAPPANSAAPASGVSVPGPEQTTPELAVAGPNYLRHYPYVSVFPTEVELDQYYSSMTNTQNLLGYVRPEEAAEAAPVEHKVVVLGLRALQDARKVFEDELSKLPNKDNVLPIPEPKVLQVVKKPHVRNNFISDTSGMKFTIFSVNVSPPEGGTDIKKGKAGDKPGPKGDKKGEQVNPLEIAPEGCEKRSRWVIPAERSVEVVLCFWSTAVGNFDQKFVFEGLNGLHQAKLFCKGVCAEPQISCGYKHVRASNTKLSAAAKLQKTLFITQATLDFGPLPTGRSADGFPNLPDSDHCKRLEIANVGLFDLHVDFEVGQGADVGAGATKKPAKPAAGGKSLFMVSPPAMDLKIGEKMPLSIYCYPPQGQLGPLEGKLVCAIVNNPRPVEYKVTCLADTPRMELDINTITFDRLLLNHEDQKCFKIRNVSALLVYWRILGLEAGPTEFTFSETSGSLSALSTATVDITLKAVEEKTLNLKLKLQVFETKESEKPAQELPLTITAEAYKIDIAIKYPNAPEEMPPDGGFNYGTLKVAQDSLKSLTMDNKGKYKVGFKFICKSPMLQGLFTITPPEGVLDPKKQQKVDVHFNKDKKLQKEVILNQNQDLELHLIEPLTNKVEQAVTVRVNLNAVHSKFQLYPAQSLHFGSQICGSTPAPRVLKLVNNGAFDFTFKLVAAAEANSEDRDAAKAADKAKKPDPKKAGGAGDALDLTSFRLVPSSGSVPAGGQMEISVYFKTDVPSQATENVKIDIADTDPFNFPGGISYELSGDSCIPGIKADPRTIFYEYQVVDEIDILGPIPNFGLFSKREELFSFGPVIINYEKAALDASGNKEVRKSKREACVTARLRIENHLPVPCSLQFLIKKLGNKPVAKGAPEELLCMELFPLSADIPPFEHRIVSCCFKPLALQKYVGLFEVLVKGETTPRFRCEFRGEGTLPRLDVESPSVLSPLGFPLLQFPRLPIGKSQALPIVLQNNGLVPAAARLESSDPSADWLQVQHAVEGHLVPFSFSERLYMPVGASETVVVTFRPRAGQKYNQDVQLVVDQNPFDVLTISIAGEGYAEEVVCVGLPKDYDDTIWFEDCGLGSTESISFTMKNLSSEKHFRFSWPTDIEFLKFTPALGHLYAATSKDIVATFSPSKTVEYLDKEICFQICSILYTERGDPPDWDERMVPPPDPAAQDPKAKVKPPPPPKPKGKLDPKAGPELTIESNLLPEESAVQVVQGTGKAVLLRLHAVADNIKYECSVENVQFKATMMFQVRTFPFTVKNISKTCMRVNWQVEKQDGVFDRASMYVIEPASGLLSPQETGSYVLKFCPLEVEDCARLVSAPVPYLDASMKPLRISTNGQVTRPWCHFELAKSDYASRRDPHFAGPNGELGPLDPAIQIIEFDSLGSKVRNVKFFTAVNPTSIPYKFVWEEKKSQSLRWTPYDLEPITDEDVFPRPFKCMTRSGEIRSGKRYEMGFEYTPNKLECNESFWVFRIPERKIEVNFLMVGNVKTPELSLDRSFVDFGRVFVGAKARATVYLRNPEVGPFAFSFDKLSYSPSQPGQAAILKFTPWTGVVAENSTVPVELLFSPVVEGEHSFDIVCNVKMASSLSLSVKADAYIFHETLYLEGGADGRPVPLVPQEPLKIDYGRVIVNSKIYKKFILTNTGKEPFHFMWHCGDNKQLVSADPVAGVVATDEQLTCDILFNPSAPDVFRDLVIVCQVLHGNKYVFHLNGTCYSPKLRFSFTEFDFGPCFLHQQGLVPQSTSLTFTNNDSEVISNELMYESTPYLEVDPVSLSLKPGQSHTIKIVFKPDAIVKYKEAVKFQICGLDVVIVTIRGEGVPVLLELVDPKQRLVSFGMVRLGKSCKQVVQVVNKSKIPAPISFGPCKDIFQALGVSCLPKEGLHLPERGNLGSTGAMELVYEPKTMMTHWTEGLVVEVAGVKCRLLTLSGVCLAVDVKLNTNVMPFDIVTLGSKVTKKIQLENVGDLATNFHWNVSKWKTDFTIFPMEGFLAPRQAAKVDITFHPRVPNPDIRVEGVSCEIEGSKPQLLTLLGGCVAQGAAAEVLKFSAPVRSSEAKTIQVKNPTTQDWLLHPVISHPFWSGAVTLAVAANNTIGYTLTFTPMTMCVPSTEPHKGTVAFPIPDGSLISYQLLGEAGPPLPDGEIKVGAKARKTVPISLQVPNWLKATQKFVSVVQMKQSDPSTLLRAPTTFEVPGISKKECQVYFYAEKPGSTTASVSFKNEKTGEYSLFNITVNTAKADTVERVKLECFVRQRTTHTIYLRNVLEKDLTFKSSCPEQTVSVSPSQLEVKADSASPVEVAFRPLVAINTTCVLVFSNEVVGDYEYELVLKGAAAPPESELSFSVSLGNSMAQAFKFTHLLPKATTYSCALSEAALGAGFTVEPATLQATPAGPDGLPLQVQVNFEPPRNFESFEGVLTLKSQDGCDYCCQLAGSCSPPSPQGPFFIKGSGQINFKNVYNDTVQFNYSTDNPSFVVSKGEKMPPKKQSKLVVTYKVVSPDSPATGRLTVTCEETSDVWLFYLQAI